MTRRFAPCALLLLGLLDCTKHDVPDDLGVAPGVDASTEVDANALDAPTGDGATSDSDVFVFGATPAGIMAAIQVSRLGKSVTLVEPTHWIGGMVAGGLSETDSGTWQVIGGLALELFQNTTVVEKTVGGGPAYNGDTIIFNVEPHVARQAFVAMLAAANVTYRVDAPLASVHKSGTTIDQVTLADGSVHSARVFIDASYEGDLMAQSGVPYTIGREALSQLEMDSGVQVPTLVSTGISPYVNATDPTSGLLPEVVAGPAQAPGSSDNHVMAYNYRLCATNASNRIAFNATMPPGYTTSTYAGVARLITALAGSGQSGEQIARQFFYPPYQVGSNPEQYYPYANGKFDVNSGTPFSTDVVQLVDAYPDGDWTVRRQIAARIQSYALGLFYYLTTSAPADVQTFLKGFGYCADEFTDNANFPTQLYVREGRRMKGQYVMTEADVLYQATNPPADVIGFGGYNMDSHLHQLIEMNGKLYEEGGGQAIKGYNCGNTYPICMTAPGTPFPIYYSSIVPKAVDVTNLLVPVTMSATSVAYRAIRLEPQYMIMGQAAGAAASLAIDDSTTVQGVDYTKLQALLLTPATSTQPPAVLTKPSTPCMLKGMSYDNNMTITAYTKATTTTCTSQMFTCAIGVWQNTSNISAVAYYPTCAAALQ